MKNIFSCGIIGYGYMGKIRHNNINNIKNLKLKFICDTNTKLIPINSNYKIVNNYQLVINSDVDIIFVCTPNNLSPKIVIEGLKRKKNVFCEKPPAKNISEIKRIKKYLNNKSKLMFGFNHRFHPAVIKAKDLIKSNAVPIGLSTQSVADLKEMATRLLIPYDIVSDSELRLSKALNLPTFKVNNLVFVKRLTLIVESSIIKKVFYPIFPPDLHIHEVLAWLKKN